MGNQKQPIKRERGGQRLTPVTKGRRWAAVGYGSALTLVEIVAKARVYYVVREWPSGAEHRYTREHFVQTWWSKEHALASIDKYRIARHEYQVRNRKLVAALDALHMELAALYDEEAVALKVALENKPPPPPGPRPNISGETP